MLLLLDIIIIINLAIINFPHLDSNIPTVPTYEVYMSQRMRYAVLL